MRSRAGSGPHSTHSKTPANQHAEHEFTKPRSVPLSVARLHRRLGPEHWCGESLSAAGRSDRMPALTRAIQQAFRAPSSSRPLRCAGVPLLPRARGREAQARQSRALVFVRRARWSLPRGKRWRLGGRRPGAGSPRPPDNTLPPGGLLWDVSARSVSYVQLRQGFLRDPWQDDDVSMKTTSQATRARVAAGTQRGSGLPGG
jgi:hypothetical protein